MTQSISNSKKTFLFLQGPPSTFPCELASELEARGHTCLRINLCLGDCVFWKKSGATHYFGKFRKWADFLDSFVRKHNITDILYYADRLPYHRVAAEVARAHNIRAYAYEFGYLRPDWITLERNGMSTHSNFPEDPAHILQMAEGLPEPDMEPYHSYSFSKEATNEVIFNLLNYFGKVPFLHYRADKFYDPLLEYLRYIPRLMRGNAKKEAATALILELVSKQTPYYVFPLQMQNDYQLRANSNYRLQENALRDIITSFAENAPNTCHLVCKVHPLDNGIEPWEKIAEAHAKSLGISDRVHLIDGGNLTNLLAHCSGVITINSTTALHTMRAGKPVKVLGIAVYDIEGLTFKGTLNAFWTEGTPPDPTLYNAFTRLLGASIQVKGNFYTKKGRIKAAKGMADKLIDETVNEPNAYISPPPRLKKARKMGAPFT